MIQLSRNLRWASLALLASIAFSSNVSAERFGVLIGIDQYAHLSSGEQLRGCVNDVDLVQQMLQSEQTFKPNHLIILKNKAATRDEIKAAMETTLRRVRTCNESGTPAEIIFHYSGHGSQTMDQFQGPLRDEPSYFDQTIVPHDAQQLGGERDIRDDELRAWAVDISSDPSNRLLVVLDCCHSGTGLRGNTTRYRRLDRSLPTPATDQFSAIAFEAELPGNTAFVSACRADQLEPETNSAGRPHGLLTLSLARVSALFQNADRGSSIPIMRLGDLLRCQYQLNQNSEKQLGVLPEPQIEYSGKMAGESLWMADAKQPVDANGESETELSMIEIEADANGDITDGEIGILKRGMIDSIRPGSTFPIQFADAEKVGALVPAGTATVVEVGFDQSRLRLHYNDDASQIRPAMVFARRVTDSMQSPQTILNPDQSPGEIVSRRLSQLIAEHIATTGQANSGIQTQLMVGQRSQNDGRQIEWRPVAERSQGRPTLDVGDIYAIEVQHDHAMTQDLFATIIHVDPNDEISLMCPRSFTETNERHQLIDGVQGVRSSGFICNGDAQLPEDDPEYQPPVKGLNRAIILVGTRPINLSSVFRFLQSSNRSLTRAESQPRIAIDFFETESEGLRSEKSDSRKDAVWWDGQSLEWISR